MKIHIGLSALPVGGFAMVDVSPLTPDVVARYDHIFASVKDQPAASCEAEPVASKNIKADPEHAHARAAA